MPERLSREELEQRVRELEKAEAEHRRIENELRISKKLLGDVMDIVPAFICAKNLDGRFLLANKKLAEFYRTTVEEMTGKLHAELCNDEVELQSMLNDDREVMESGKPKTILEETMEHPDGSITVLDTYKIPFTAYEDPAVLIVAADVTERKEVEKERAELQERFLQTQKMESVGRLAGGVAHDLNNLLSPIIGFAEMLHQDLSSNEEGRQFTEQIIKAGTRAKDIVQQLLAFSRQQTLQFKTLKLNEVLTHFEELLRRTIRENITISYDFAPQLSNFLGDSGQIEQVIVNLAVNAQDAMPEGGTLTIKTFMTELVGQSDDGCELPLGPYVGLRVSDSGCGMDSETCAHIFEPFFTTKGEYGTGLGLATVYGIVKQHGGNIRVESELGSGTVFTVYLLATEEAEIVPERETPEPTDLHGSETVLLVEDNEQVRKLAYEILRRYGYKVIVAEDGQAALETFDRCNETIQLLLTDVILPHINGWELSKQIFERNPAIKTLYMSGYSDDVIASQNLMDNEEGFIQKPFSVEVLASKVRKVLDGRPLNPQDVFLFENNSSSEGKKKVS